jgi:hypothetical protein
VKIIGDLTDEGWGGHIFIAGQAVVKISGVEMYNMGTLYTLPVLYRSMLPNRCTHVIAAVTNYYCCKCFCYCSRYLSCACRPAGRIESVCHQLPRRRLHRKLRPPLFHLLLVAEVPHSICSILIPMPLPYISKYALSRE